jgi:hypothetical protein
MISGMKQLSQRLDYASMAQKLGTASIVGFGESTHGTHEFFQTKTEIFKALVELIAYLPLSANRSQDRPDQHGPETYAWFAPSGSVVF